MQNWNKDNVWSLINKNKISPLNRIFKYYDKHINYQIYSYWVIAQVGGYILWLLLKYILIHFKMACMVQSTDNVIS